MVRTARHDADEDERLRYEARLVAGLDHPGIVPVHDAGESEGRRYVAMRYLKGGTLTQRIQDYYGAPRKIAELMISVAEAVQFAHRHRVVHRDLKPSNILFDLEGRPYVADFGLATRIAFGDFEPARLSGTLSFLAPEVIAENMVSTAADVYSLGVVLYQLLARCLPFRSRLAAGLVRAVLHDTPEPPRALDSSVPRDLEALCLAALAKDPEVRPSLDEFIADCRRYLRGEPLATRPVRSFERCRMWARRRPAGGGSPGRRCGRGLLHSRGGRRLHSLPARRRGA